MNKYYAIAPVVIIPALVSFLAWNSYKLAYLATYGIVAVWSCLIFGTFMYLYIKRCSSIALAMSLTWFGTMGLLGWWWAYQVLGRPIQMTNNPVLFVGLSFHMVGAWLHFKAFQEFSDSSLWLRFAGLTGVVMVGFVVLLNPS